MINNKPSKQPCAANTKEGAYLGLKNFMGKVCEITDEDWQQLLAHSSFQTIKKSELLLTANEKSGHLWFIFQGLVRNFYTTKEGKEFNKSFLCAPSFCGSMSEIVSDDPSRFSIDALEDSTAIAISIEWFRKASSTNSTLKTFALVLAEKLALKKELREAELLSDDATTRYQHFLADNPQLSGRLPAYHIASYLGITEVALSRIKRKLKA